jgi:hypothetical protein
MVRLLTAAEAEMTPSDDDKFELEQMPPRPTLAEIADRLRALDPVELDEPVVDILQKAREAR